MDMSTWVTVGDLSLHLSRTDVTGKFTMDMSTWVTAGDLSLHLSRTYVTGKFTKSTKIEWNVEDCKTKLYFFGAGELSMPVLLTFSTKNDEICKIPILLQHCSLLR